MEHATNNVNIVALEMQLLNIALSYTRIRHCDQKLLFAD
jgi:hypothetical protein